MSEEVSNVGNTGTYIKEWNVAQTKMAGFVKSLIVEDYDFPHHTGIHR